MKNKKTAVLHKLTAILSILAIFCSSCSKDNDSPAYVGSWMALKPIPRTTGYTQIEYSLKLSDSTYTESFGNYKSRSSYSIEYVFIEGSLSVSGNIMTFTAKKISLSNYDSTTSTASEPYVVYTKDDHDIEGMLPSFILINSGHNVEYTLLEDGLNLKVDYNKNGDFSDDHEAFLYQRQ